MSSEIEILDPAPVVEVIYEKDLSSEEPPMDEWSSLQFEVSEKNIKRIEHAQGLYDEGSGEICAKYIEVSASSVLQHVYYNYPGIKDPGIEEAILFPDPQVILPDDGLELYLDLCEKIKLCPVRKFYGGLLQDKIDLKYYGVNPKSYRAMAMALKRNKFVKELDLTDNWISKDGCFHLGEMLIDNITITYLNLKGCRIGVAGAMRLFANLHLNQSLRHLDVSRNELGDHGVELLASAILKGVNLRKVNLCYNKITGKSLAALAEAFETNNSLTHLDLSWNNLSLSPNGLLAVCTQLSGNVLLEELNLSWNYLNGKITGNAITILLKNPEIRQLNLSNNKLEGQTVKDIAANLSKAKKLEELNLSFNPLTVDDAIKVLERLKERRVKLKRLLLDNVIVDSAFIDLRNEILKYDFRPDTVITCGNVRQKFTPTTKDIREIVFDRCEAICKKSKRKPIDISLVIQQIYRDGPEPKGTRVFAKEVRARGAQLDDDLIEELANRFPGPKSEKMKLINLAAMIDYLKRKWPDRKLPTTPNPPPSPPEPVPLPNKNKKLKK